SRPGSSLHAASPRFTLSLVFIFSSRRRHTRSKRDWSSDVCSSDLQYRYRITADGETFLQQFPCDMPDFHNPLALLQDKSSRFLELVATMLYFRDLPRDEVEEKVHLVKPKQKYSDDELAKAWTLIDQLIE